MTGTAQTAKAVAVVCGSNSLVGGMVTTRLRDAGWDVFTIDPPHAAPHPAARVRIKGEIWEAAAWAALLKSLPDSGQPPGIFVHAFGDSENDAGAISNHALRSAEQGARHLLPAMTAGGAVAFVASVLAGWDTRAGAAAFSAGQAGILALMRSLALSAAPSGIRVNAVCTGIVTTEPDVAPAAVRGRIPLGRTASPDDVADAVLFLLSSDASHVTGSTLIVDGGQSLQSWSNAPREGGYPLVIAPTSERKNGVSLSDSERAESRQCETDGGRTTRFFVPQNDTATVQDTTTQRDTATPQRFQNQTVLITGAAGGLGSAAARRFAVEGARLALLDRDQGAAAELARDLAASGHQALAVEVDVADERSFASAIARAEERFGRINVLFNNAGVGGGNVSIAAMPAADWDEVIAINLRGVFLGCKLGVPALMRAGGGAIVNMGSSTGRHDTITGGAVYMASKAAVEALTKSLALQVAPYGIRTNTICPGIIETALSFRQQERGGQEQFFAGFADRIPLGRVGQPEDVAAAVAFLASDQARHITGASLLIDGGQTLRKWISAPDIDLTFAEESSP